MNKAIGAEGVKRDAVGHDAHEYRLAQIDYDCESGGVNGQQAQDRDSFAVAEADAAIPFVLGGSAAATISPCIVDECLAPHAAKDTGAGIDTFRAVRAFELVRGLADIDAHGTGTYAFLAMDAPAAFILKKHLKGVLIGEHVLQVAVWADGGAEGLAQESEVEERYQRDAGAHDATGGADVEREKAVKEVGGRNKKRHEDEGKENGSRQ